MNEQPNRLENPTRLALLSASGLMDSASEDAFDRITRLVTRVLKVPVALVSLVDEHRQFFKSAAGLAEPWATRRETPLTHSFCQHVVQNGDLCITDSAESWLKDNRAVSELGVAAYAGVPLALGSGHHLGALCAIDTRPRTWSDEDLEVLRELGASVAREIELRLATLSEARQAAFMRAIVTSMNDTVVVADPQGQPVIQNAAFTRALSRSEGAKLDGSSIFYPDQTTPYPLAELPLQRALRGEHVVACEVFVRPPGAEGRWHEVSASPVIDPQGRHWGAVAVGRDVTPAKALHARIAAQAEELQTLALYDPLTGLHNRRGLIVIGTQMMKLAERLAEPVTVVFIDVDGLKAVNDNFGHAAGDTLLVDVSRILRQTFRTSDLMARVGGDEFVLVLPGDQSDSERPVERLRAAYYKANLIEGRPYRISLSIGIAARDPTRPATLDALIDHADRAMYSERKVSRGL